MKLIILTKLIVIFVFMSYLFTCITDHLGEETTEDFRQIFDVLKVIFIIFIYVYFSK